MNWIEISNRVFEIINESGPNYFSGPRFIGIVKEIKSYFPDYGNYIEQRRQENKSTSRKDYFRDILMSFDEDERIRLVKKILQQTQSNNPQKTAELNTILMGEATAPIATVPEHIWNADRLNGYLEDIDASITSGNHKRAISLSYTCLEGFFRAFIQHNMPDKIHITEIIALAKEIQRYLKDTIPDYPDEALKLINHIAHTIDKTRNSFSESHFGNEAEKWLSNFIRDCTNSAIRLLLSFM
jgi:hypothetical protein